MESGKSGRAGPPRAAAAHANVMLAVAAHVKPNNITFVGDNRLLTLFEGRAEQRLRGGEGRIQQGIIVLRETPG